MSPPTHRRAPVGAVVLFGCVGMLAVALALFGALFIAALGEELGWVGYAIDPLQQRWGALGSHGGQRRGRASGYVRR